MNEIERIKDQLSRTFGGESWTGPSVMEVLKDVEPEKAASRPIPEAHSIWELAYLFVYKIGVRSRRLKGDFSTMTEEEDWPKVKDTSKKSWDELISRLKANHSELLSEVSKLSPDVLEKPMKEGFSSYYVTLHGVAQHNQYHLGQISILKKGYFSTKGMMSH